MRPEEIKELIRMVEESEISELEMSDGRRSIRISKAGATPAQAPLAAAPAPPPAATPQAPPAQTDEPAGDAGLAVVENLASNLKQIASPMVGTIYRAPSPGSEPFIEVGQRVAVGQTVCIVEAMKLMNEIGSDYDGIVRKVLVENSQPVEYGQPLFLIEEK